MNLKPEFKSTQGERRAILSAVLGLLVMPIRTSAESWPSKPLRLIVPFPAGGPTDTVSRIVGEELARRLGQPVVVENKSGASGAIGANAAAAAAPDGYTLMMLATPTLVAPHLIAKSGYDVQKSFAPIAKVYDLPVVIIVNPAVLPQVNDMQGLVTRARQQRLHYTTSGAGSVGHLSMELLKDVGHFDMDHVPYRGGAPAIAALLAGDVPIMYADLVVALPHIKAGRVIAIAAGDRTAALPQVKTIGEQGFPGFDAVPWGGLLAPAGTPAAVLKRLEQEVQAILATPAIQDKLAAVGTVASYSPGALLAKRIAQDDAKWGAVVRDKKITAG